MEDSTLTTDPLQTLFSRTLDSGDDVSNALLTPIQPSATMLDFSFLGIEGNLVRDLVRGAVRRRDRGINILIHGRPGTGKTEFVRSLVRELAIPGFSVPAVDDAGREASRTDRLAAYQLTQRLASSDSGCFVFLDEAEDIFPEEDLGFAARKRAGAQSKAWVNQLLEENVWPTIWVSNRIRQIDPAYLRRFRLVMPFPGLDESARTAMVDAVLGDLNPGPAVHRVLCEQPGTTPGVVTTLHSILQTTEATGETAHRYAGLALRRYADALNLDIPMSTRREHFAYDPAWLNWKSTIPAAKLIARMRESTPMTLLLHGKPGTGKTAFGDYLCRGTGRALVYRTASDLLSKWLGESEQNIRDLFINADTEKTIIFLDECDSLLGARALAAHRWETSLVNEFLRGIERFEGIFIAATNHVANLDPALMRRFHAKVELLPMRPRERTALLESILEAPLSPTGHARLAGMPAVTLGDVHNALQFLPRPYHEVAILDALAEELRYRNDPQSRSIGFSATIGE
jgi:SpoVK/Ycf46/Vps4 family AAA+-type ATPase